MLEYLPYEEGIKTQQCLLALRRLHLLEYLPYEEGIKTPLPNPIRVVTMLEYLPYEEGIKTLLLRRSCWLTSWSTYPMKRVLRPGMYPHYTQE